LQEHRQGVHLPSFGDEPVGGYTTKSVTHGHAIQLSSPGISIIAHVLDTPIQTVTVSLARCCNQRCI